MNRADNELKALLDSLHALIVPGPTMKDIEIDLPMWIERAPNLRSITLSKADGFTGIHHAAGSLDSINWNRLKASLSITNNVRELRFIEWYHPAAVPTYMEQLSALVQPHLSLFVQMNRSEDAITDFMMGASVYSLL